MMGSIASDLAPVVGDLWRARLRSLTDAALATSLRGWSRWRADFLRFAAEIAACDPLEAERWRRGAEGCFASLAGPLVAEARRRARVRRLPPRRRVSVDDLLNRFPDRIRPAGNGRYRTECPWHPDARPSMVIYDDHCHCYACSAHRPLADLLAAWRREAA